MKKVALTVAVLALGLAACEDNAPDNATSTVNTVEMEANADTAAAANSVDNALDATENAVDNTVEATDNAADNADNAM
ncbi:MAG TPA: circumsporozoite protein [Sphingomicrobium sp.]|nr:circumsporozoite protein [Sphingomicrobium sp.]